MEATLTPLMEAIEARHAGVRVFSLPSVDHPQWGRHIELGVKGAPARVGAGVSRSCWRACVSMTRSSAPSWCDSRHSPHCGQCDGAP